MDLGFEPRPSSETKRRTCLGIAQKVSTQEHAVSSFGVFIPPSFIRSFLPPSLCPSIHPSLLCAERCSRCWGFSPGQRIHPLEGSILVEEINRAGNHAVSDWESYEDEW